VLRFPAKKCDTNPGTLANQTRTDPIEIPVATLPIKLLMSFACLFIILVVLWWGVAKFRTYLRVATGREPRKPGTRTIHLALGFLVYLIIFAPAVIAELIFLEITTTPPSIVSARRLRRWRRTLLSQNDRLGRSNPRRLLHQPHHRVTSFEWSLRPKKSNWAAAGTCPASATTSSPRTSHRHALSQQVTIVSHQ
jgi:hypothetical protein